MDNIKNAPDGQEQIKSKLHKITGDIRQIFLEYDLTYSEIKSVLNRIEAELSPENRLSKVNLYLNNVKYKELITMPYAQGSTNTLFEVLKLEPGATINLEH